MTTESLFDVGPDKVWHRMMRSMRPTILYASVAGFFLIAQAALAAPSCTFTGVTNVSFGAYNVYAALPNNNGVGSLTINCNNQGSATKNVTLSTGQSNSYASRIMSSGVNHLNYNLYTNSARTTVWGDGTGGSNIMTVSRNGSTTLSIYGTIPAGQDASVGSYTDSITITVTF